MKYKIGDIIFYIPGEEYAVVISINNNKKEIWGIWNNNIEKAKKDYDKFKGKPFEEIQRSNIGKFSYMTENSNNIRKTGVYDCKITNWRNEFK